MANTTPRQALRRFHALGKRSNRVGDRRKKREHAVWGTLEELGAETRAEKNRLMEARRFARLYDEKELAFLCRLGQGKWKLTRTHVLQLIRVVVRQQRIDLANKCAENNWSVRELKLEIDRLGLHRAYGGRKQKPPRSTDEALLISERLLSGLIRWHSVIAPVERETSKRSRSGVKKLRRTSRKGAGPRRLPDKIQVALVEISEAAFGLCENIRDELEKRRRKPRKKAARRK